jgi:hypothetical protein
MAGAAAPLVVSAPAAAQTGNFSDVSFSYWARPFIQRLAQENVIAGFPDGTFKPEQPVTRAQFAALINQAFNKPAVRSARNFSDVSANYWAQAAIQSAYRTGFLSGYPDGTFRPNQPITRTEAIVSLINGLGLRATGSIDATLDTYQDEDQIPNYAKDELAAATQRNIVVNYPDVAFFTPLQSATRADISGFIYQTLVSQGTLDKLGPSVGATKYIVGYSTTGTTTGNTDGTTTNTGLRVAQETTIDVESPNPGNIVIAPGQTYVTTLRVAADLKNSQGQVLIPKGSLIGGQLEPVAVSGSPVNGARFVANQLTIGSTTYSINAASAPIAATVAQQVSDQTLQGAAVTRAAQAILSGQVSDLGSIIGQALGGVTGTPTSQSYVISVNPNTQLDLKVQEAFNVRSST